MAVKHTPECIQSEQELREFTAKHPHMCGSCGGRGSWHDFGTYWDPPDGGPCDACVEQGICPQCGDNRLILREGEHYDHCVCEGCGWDEQKANDPTPNDAPYPVMPEYECWCWEDQTREENDDGT